MKKCKYRECVQGLSNGIFVCKLLHSPVYCPTNDIKCFINIKEE